MKDRRKEGMRKERKTEMRKEIKKKEKRYERRQSTKVRKLLLTHVMNPRDLL